MNAIGMIEVVSIPIGILAGDSMLKTANVKLVMAQAVCAGKYIVIVTGNNMAVTAAVKAGVETAGNKLVDTNVIARVDSQVAKALTGVADITNVLAVGVMETFSLVAAIYAADVAVKTASVELIEIRLARGMGGKSFVIITGDVSAVKAAVEAAENDEATKGMMAESVVIPAPHPDIVNALL